MSDATHSLPQLNRLVATSLTPQDGVFLPTEASYQLPEKVLQFGTGVLLRGLIDFFIDKANKQGVFNGRVVVVKSTASGGADAFTTQDGTFTHQVKGLDNGKLVEETWLNNSISRVLAAKSEWASILEVAASPALEVIVSNTTEVGISYQEEDIKTSLTPESYPAKLLAVLWHRYQTAGGSAAKGLVIIPTELIVDNGKKLKEIVLKLAAFNELDQDFISWVSDKNWFCSSLVDRIVPGKPAPDVLDSAAAELGYQDELFIMSEWYRLWAIEGGEDVKRILTFAQADHGVIIADDITPYRERKLRLLNGVHTISVALAYLADYNTVLEMMQSETLGQFVERVAHDEFVPSVRVDQESAKVFAHEVLDRFRNPNIVHLLINITLQYSSKMQMRNVQVLENYVEDHGKAPRLFALGFAAYLLFSRPAHQEEGKVLGARNGTAYPINDDKALILAKHWAGFDGNYGALTQAILSDAALWSTDLNKLADFAAQVTTALDSLATTNDIKQVVAAYLA